MLKKPKSISVRVFETNENPPLPPCGRRQIRVVYDVVCVCWTRRTDDRSGFDGARDFRYRPTPRRAPTAFRTSTTVAADGAVRRKTNTTKRTTVDDESRVRRVCRALYTGIPDIPSGLWTRARHPSDRCTRKHVTRMFIVFRVVTGFDEPRRPRNRIPISYLSR